MAARLNREHDEKTRSKIQTTQIINRLQNHSLGKNKMTMTQIRAAEVILRKTLPDLKAVEISGPGGEAVQFIVEK